MGLTAKYRWRMEQVLCGGPNDGPESDPSSRLLRDEKREKRRGHREENRKGRFSRSIGKRDT